MNVLISEAMNCIKYASNIVAIMTEHAYNKRFPIKIVVNGGIKMLFYGGLKMLFFGGNKCLLLADRFFI